MGRVIALVSGKGGTGKSTVACNLGTALAELGKKTVVVDADLTMANVGLMLGLHDKKITLHEVLAGKAKVERAVYRSFHNLAVVPCGLSLEGVESMRLERIKPAVQSLSRDADFLLLDCPSGFGEDTLAPLSSAQEAAIVLNPDFASITNAMNAKSMVERAGLRLTGLILNRVGRWGISSRKVGLTVGATILGEIPDDPQVARASSVGEPVLIFSPRSPASKAFRKLARVLVEHGK
ncbi:MAG: cell division ATPase MinD [Candidatus Hadarchaeales archaeon]